MIKHCRIRGKNKNAVRDQQAEFERLELPGQSKINCRSRIVDATLEQQKKQLEEANIHLGAANAAI